MKSVICPNCGCIAHIPERLIPVVKKDNPCEMCGSQPYLYDGDINPFDFPEENDGLDRVEKRSDTDPVKD